MAERMEAVSSAPHALATSALPRTVIRCGGARCRGSRHGAAVCFPAVGKWHCSWPGERSLGGTLSRRALTPPAAVLGPLSALAVSAAALRLRAAAISTGGETATAVGETTEETAWRAEAAESLEAPFEWKSNWYAVGVPANLDPSRPHPVTVLGKRVVLWRDPHLQALIEAGDDEKEEGAGKGKPRPKTAWRCFLDRCPHRLVPLSEGRIDEHGQLQCSYHGWTFSGDGACTGIPQAASQGPEHAAVKSPRACATPLPITEETGILFVWPDESPEAFPRAMATPPPMPAGIDQFSSFGRYSREFAYGYEMLAENLMDPAHLPFAHHGVGTLHRSLGQPFPVAAVISESEGVGGFLGRLLEPRIPCFSPVQFQAPGLYVHHLSLKYASGGRGPRRQGQGSTPLDALEETTFEDVASGAAGPMYLSAFFLTPVSPGRSRLTFMDARDPLPQGLLSRMMRGQLWVHHLFVHKVVDGDTYFLHAQEKVVDAIKDSSAGELRGIHNGAPDSGRASPVSSLVSSAYFLPTSADRFVIAFRKWLDRFGGGQVAWPDEYAAARLSPDWGQKTEILDRYASHTAQCKSCQDALAGFQLAQKVAIAAAVVMLLTAVSLRVQLHVIGRAALLLLGAACGGLSIALQKMIDEFIFVGYDHATR